MEGLGKTRKSAMELVELEEATRIERRSKGSKGALIWLAFFISFFSVVHGATIEGRVYGPDLSLVKNSIVSINTTPKQVMVVKEGEYSFNVSSGEYLISAVYEENGTFYYAEENVSVRGEGRFVLDLILLPSFDEDIGDFNFEGVEFKGGGVENAGQEGQGKEAPQDMFWPLIAALLLIGLGGALAYHKLIKEARRRVDNKGEPANINEEREELSEDGKLALQLLKESEGRMTQKELRKTLGWSEAKTSLLLVELESQGYLKRIKRGRGNIIVLKHYPVKND